MAHVTVEQAVKKAKAEHRSRYVKKIVAWRFRVAGVRLLLLVYSATSQEPILGEDRSTDYRWQLYTNEHPAGGGIIKTEYHD
jgi:hypothetical protein